MTTVRRFDRAELKNTVKTPQGYLRAPAAATRCGIFTYRRADGSVFRELRHPDDVFRSDSLATLSGVPVTNQHPPAELNGGMLDAKSTKQYMCGYTSDDVSRDGTLVMTRVTLTDDALISQVESGELSEVSCGYECELDETPGEYEGLPYDARQINITYNHLAVVKQGRGGPSVRLRLDSADAVMIDNSQDSKIQRKDSVMEKIVVNGQTFEVDENLAKAFRADQSEIAAVRKKLDSAEARADGYKSDLEAEKTKTEELAERVKKADSDETFFEKYTARRDLESVARRCLENEMVAKLDSMSNDDIRIEVIKAKSPKADLSSKSQDYIQSRFDHIAETLDEKKSSRADESLGDEIVEGRNKRSDSSASEEARLRAQKDAAEAWKKPSIGISRE